MPAIMTCLELAAARAKSSVTSAVVLQALRWLRRTPESFLAGHDAAPKAEEALPGEQIAPVTLQLSIDPGTTIARTFELT